MERWNIRPAFRDNFGREFLTIDEAFRAECEHVRGTVDNSHSVRKIGATTSYYMKIYTARNGLKASLLGSNAEREFNNLLFMESVGVLVPPVVAHGERDCADGRHQSVLVTQEVENSVDLRLLAETNHSLLGNRQWFNSLSTKLARAVAQLHQHRFAHNDLNWRNILVVADDDPQVYLLDCARGRRWIAPFLQFRIIKDLTHLDKFGQRYLTRTQRLHFYLAYCGERRLSAASKRRLRRILTRQADARHQPTDYSAAHDEQERVKSRH